MRAPANHCALFGLRPTHGRISLEGVLDLAPSFDTCGWFTRDVRDLRARRGRAARRRRRRRCPSASGCSRRPTCGPARARRCARRSAAPRDAGRGGARRRGAGRGRARRLRRDVLELSLRAGARGVAHRRPADRALRAAARPGRGRALRVVARRHATRRSATATAFRERFRSHLAALLGDDGVLVMPTMPDIAPLAQRQRGRRSRTTATVRSGCSASRACAASRSSRCRSHAPRRAARHLVARPGGQRPQPGAARRAIDRRGVVARNGEAAGAPSCR